MCDRTVRIRYARDLQERHVNEHEAFDHLRYKTMLRTHSTVLDVMPSSILLNGDNIDSVECRFGSLPPTHRQQQNSEMGNQARRSWTCQMCQNGNLYTLAEESNVNADHSNTQPMETCIRCGLKKKTMSQEFRDRVTPSSSDVSLPVSSSGTNTSVIVVSLPAQEGYGEYLPQSDMTSPRRVSAASANRCNDDRAQRLRPISWRLHQTGTTSTSTDNSIIENCHESHMCSTCLPRSRIIFLPKMEWLLMMGF